MHNSYFLKVNPFSHGGSLKSINNDKPFHNLFVCQTQKILSQIYLKHNSINATKSHIFVFITRRVLLFFVDIPQFETQVLKHRVSICILKKVFKRLSHLKLNLKTLICFIINFSNSLRTSEKFFTLRSHYEKQNTRVFLYYHRLSVLLG